MGREIYQVEVLGTTRDRRVRWLNHARESGVRERGNGRVNQEIAKHTQNSTARWNLNSVSARELNSLQRRLLRLSSSFRDVSSLTFPRLTPPHHPLHANHLRPPLAPSVSLSRRASRASYSLSFVIRKQTGRRSCQVGGVGDETAVSVCPFFFHRRRRPRVT